MNRRARWLLRSGALSLVVLLALLDGRPALSQQEEQVGMRDTGYYTDTQDPLGVIGGIYFELCQQPQFPLPEACLDPSSVTGTTPGWPRQDNYVYVARILGDDDAYGYAAVDLLSIPIGSTVRGLEYEFQIEANQDSGTLQIDPGEPQFDPENPHLRLCLVTEDWVGVDGGSWEHRPAHDCGVSAEVEFVSDEERVEPEPLTGEDRDRRVVTYRADLLAMATSWANGENHGFAFIPTETAPDIWQVAIRTNFIAQDAMVARVTYDPPPPPPPVSDLGVMPSFRAAPPVPDQFIPGTPGTPPRYEVIPADPPQPTQATRARLPEVDPRTPWWVWLALPIGMGVLGTLSHGMSTPAAQQTERAGPVSRLMRRGAGPTEPS